MIEEGGDLLPHLFVRRAWRSNQTKFSSAAKLSSFAQLWGGPGTGRATGRQLGPRELENFKKTKQQGMFVKGSHKFSRVLPKSWTHTQLVGLGISKVVLSSLVLRVGLQQARSISKAAEKDVLHVQERKDGSVKSFLQRNEKLEEGQGSVRRKDQGWERDLGNSLKIYCPLSSRVQHSHKCKEYWGVWFRFRIQKFQPAIQ